MKTVFEVFGTICLVCAFITVILNTHTYESIRFQEVTSHILDKDFNPEKYGETKFRPYLLPIILFGVGFITLLLLDRIA